jgi:hypothetical protein
MKNLTVSLAFVLTAVSVHAQSYDFMSALKSVKYVQRGANVVVVDPRPADNVYGGDTHEFYFDYNSASQYYQVVRYIHLIRPDYRSGSYMTSIPR